MVVARVATVVWERRRSLFALALALAAACSQGRLDLASPLPRLVIEEPARGTVLAEDRLQVRGYIDAPDASMHDAVVHIDDRLVQVDADGRFELSMTPSPGLQLLHSEARLGDGRTLADTRAVLAGPLADPGARSPASVRVHLDSATIAAVADAAGRAFSGADLSAALSALAPKSTGDGCFRANLGLTELSIDDIDIHTRAIDGGLEVAVDLEGLRGRIGGSYSAACLSGTVDVGFTMDAYRANGILLLSAAGGSVQTSADLTRSRVDGFAITLTGVAFIDDAITNVDWLAGPALGRTLEKRLGPSFGFALQELAGQRLPMSVGDTTVLVDAEVDNLSMKEAGGYLDASTAVFIDEWSTLGYSLTERRRPLAAEPLPSAGFDVRIDDEVFHQVLSSLWNAGALRLQYDLDEDPVVGDLGTGADILNLSFELPPAVRLDAKGAPASLYFGDLMVELRKGEKTLATLAVAAELELRSGDGQTLKLGMELQQYWVDIIELRPEAVELISGDLLDPLVGAALELATARLSQLLGTLVLPSFGGTTVVSPSLFTRPGYLQLEGELGPAE